MIIIVITFIHKAISFQYPFAAKMPRERGPLLLSEAVRILERLFS